MQEDLNGLILLGGRSTRMGMDKSRVKYHKKPQDQHLFDLINDMVSETFVSVRKGQSIEFTDHLIEDVFDVRGPLNGLLSAHQAFLTKAWLVLAVDLPFITECTLERLIHERDSSMFATSLVSAESNLPEPLAAIWEPKALTTLTEHQLRGEEVYPRKFLIDNPVKSIQPEDDRELFNVNNEEDFEKAKSMMDQKK
ncbi:NTP transferase domain-containing protein [Ekhidna sp. To15]|uniref:NTP transferase domain-containing protein n=1 Tax=Ekhidna sp. To15 TaxID=3395267 RepID=UPI003F51F58A